MNKTVTLINCPACGHQLSPQAVSCPHCGHPISGREVREHQWNDTRRVGGVVQLVLVLLTVGAQGAVLKLASAEKMEDVGAATFIKVFLQTAPLTMAVMLIAMAVIRKWWTETGPLLFFSAAVLFASVLIGTWVGGLAGDPSIQGNLGMVFFRSLRFYWRAYGPGLFLSSLILGVFLAWALSKEWPLSRARTTPVA